MSQLRAFQQGNSGAEVRFHPKSDAIIIKDNPKNPARITREIHGQQILAAHPVYKHRIVQPLTVDHTARRITYPFVAGTDMRTALAEGILQDDEVEAVAREVSDVELARALDGKTSTDTFISMQRVEWPDTLRRLQGVVRELLPHVNPSAPVMVNGQAYPSLDHTVAVVGRLLENQPPITDTGHNDLTQSNILIGSDRSQGMVFIDYEWAGDADPAESLVRTAKARRTYDKSNPLHQWFAVESGSVVTDMPIIHGHQAELFEGIVTSRVPEIAEAYQDPGFSERFQIYRAGSYLRELALSGTRSDAHGAMSAVVEASMAVAHAS